MTRFRVAHVCSLLATTLILFNMQMSNFHEADLGVIGAREVILDKNIRILTFYL